MRSAAGINSSSFFATSVAVAITRALSKSSARAVTTYVCPARVNVPLYDGSHRATVGQLAREIGVHARVG